MGQKVSFDVVQKYFKSRGVVLLSKEYKNNRTPLTFKCSQCRSEYSILWDQIQRGANPDLLCLDCMKKKKSKSQSLEELKQYFASKGRVLLNTEQPNTHTTLNFICSCGKEHHIKYGDLKRGRNPDLLCLGCTAEKRKIVSSEYVKSFKEERILQWKKEFENKGAKLLSTSYKDNTDYLHFLCSVCGKEHKIQITNYISGTNPNLLCEECLFGKKVNPEGQNGGRHAVDAMWYKLVKHFFSIKKGDFDKYSAHHIIPFMQDPLFRTSIFNGFPLLKTIHYQNYRKYHNTLPFDTSSWGEEEKLPYHSYDNFSFIDFNEKIATEIIINALPYKELLHKKQEFYERGILYIPIFYEEFLTVEKEEILYSMLRNRAARIFGEVVYRYTGIKYTKIGARFCDIKVLNTQEEKQFFSATHIQGYVPSMVCIALQYNNETVCAMSFGSLRAKSLQKEGSWELLRFSCKKNSSVLGGASRLFKYFIRSYNPKEIISYCDIRFSSLDSNETLYPKLGFQFAGQSAPNYKYGHPEYNRLFSRQAFQKWKLERKLENFDPSLTEEQNMTNNGYFKLYDCGNFKFIWQSTNI